MVDEGEALCTSKHWRGEVDVKAALTNKLQQLDVALQNVEEENGSMDPFMKLLPVLLTAMMD